MKIAIFLLILGLVMGFVVPCLLREVFAGAGIVFPQFWLPKSPPRNFNLNLLMIFRFVDVILVLLAIIRFILVRAGRI